MATAIEKANGNSNPAMTLRAFLESPAAKAKLSEVASKVLRAEDLVRLALITLSRQPELAKCTQASVLRSLLDAASLGIAPGGVLGRGYLVPRKNRGTGQLECCFDPGWRGLIDIARRTGKIKRIEAHVVYQADQFDVGLGLHPTIHHIPALDVEERGGVVAAYAIAEFHDGAVQFEVLSAADLAKIRNSSASREGPWKSWPEEMARKSAVRRLCKYLPYDPLLERAVEHATDVESEDRITVDVETREPRAKTLASAIRAKAAVQTPDEQPARADDTEPPATEAAADESEAPADEPPF